ncbi:MAG TPA: hypothetical protein QGG91_01495 [Flavobacteriales bacterium]|jgi:hypothetical protein|nr:hypothetical protein [Flavobacteriales bacterium]|tara:strand:- start:62 stop:310 length:249 start_codon:yes stop_codon:yes gene_type:complete
MKKLLLILLCLPLIGFGQDNREFTIKDLIINQVLENTINYIKNKNKVTYTFKVDVPPMNNNLGWNDLRLHKWQIIEPKDTIK